MGMVKTKHLPHDHDVGDAAKKGRVELDQSPGSVLGSSGLWRMLLRIKLPRVSLSRNGARSTMTSGVMLPASASFRIRLSVSRLKKGASDSRCRESRLPV